MDLHEFIVAVVLLNDELFRSASSAAPEAIFTHRTTKHPTNSFVDGVLEIAL